MIPLRVCLSQLASFPELDRLRSLQNNTEKTFLVFTLVFLDIVKPFVVDREVGKNLLPIIVVVGLLRTNDWGAKLIKRLNRSFSSIRLGWRIPRPLVYQGGVFLLVSFFLAPSLTLHPGQCPPPGIYNARDPV